MAQALSAGSHLPLLAGQARLTPPRVVSEKLSAYGGIMYCAVLER
jgi:hypothetical protein